MPWKYKTWEKFFFNISTNRRTINVNNTTVTSKQFIENFAKKYFFLCAHNSWYFLQRCAKRGITTCSYNQYTLTLECLWFAKFISTIYIYIFIYVRVHLANNETLLRWTMQRKKGIKQISESLNLYIMTMKEFLYKDYLF